jgi:hypothetical protein
MARRASPRKHDDPFHAMPAGEHRAASGEMHATGPAASRRRRGRHADPVVTEARHAGPERGSAASPSEPCHAASCRPPSAGGWRRLLVLVPNRQSRGDENVGSTREVAARSGRNSVSSEQRVMATAGVGPDSRRPAARPSRAVTTAAAGRLDYGAGKLRQADASSAARMRLDLTPQYKGARNVREALDQEQARQALSAVDQADGEVHAQRGGDGELQAGASDERAEGQRQVCEGVAQEQARSQVHAAGEGAQHDQALGGGRLEQVHLHGQAGGRDL